MCRFLFFFFFFFKQKTAYEIRLSLVGSEMCIRDRMNIGIAILIGLLAGLALGLVCGYMIAYQNFSDWVVTYAFMGIAQGLALVASDGNTIPGFSNTFRFIATGKIFGIYTMIIIAALLCLLLVWLSTRTKFGYDAYSIGGSQQSARLAGINVKRNLLWIFIITDLLAAVSGILLAAKSNSASPIGGQGYEWDAIAAVLIGGTPFDGGKGKVSGCIIGAVLMRTLRNGLTMIGLSPYWPVSYTHLTLPTSDLVEILVDTVPLKKKKRKRESSVIIRILYKNQ